MEELISIVNDPNVIVTRSGIYFNFIKPMPSMVLLSDISYALSNINRWGGHHRQKISVAQHSITVAKLLESRGYSLEIQLQGLMHDAPEAYVGDICRPIKSKLPIFYEIEENVMFAIAKALDFDWPMFKEVKQADDDILKEEWNFGNLNQDVPGTLSAEIAKITFEQEYYRLKFLIEQANSKL